MGTNEKEHTPQKTFWSSSEVAEQQNFCSVWEARDKALLTLQSACR